MPRPERPLDPSSGPAAAFAAELRRLRAAAGSPKYLQMARLTGRSRTALAEAAGGDHVPTWETVDAYVRACGGDPADWTVRWETAKEQAAGHDRETPEEPGADRDERKVRPDPVERPAPTRSKVAAALVAAGLVLTTLGVLAAGDSGTVPTAEAEQGRVLPGRPGDAVSLSFTRFTPDTLAVGGHDGVVGIWNTRTGRLLQRVYSHDPGLTTVAFDQLDREVMATGGTGAMVRVWNTRTGEGLCTLDSPHDGTASVMAFDPENRHVLATAAAGGTIELWDTASGQRIRTFVTREPHITAVAFSPLTPNTLAVGGTAGLVDIWDSSNGTFVRTMQGRFGRIAALTFDPFTRNTLVTGEADGPLQVWDSSNGRHVRMIQNTAPVTSLAFNPLLRNSLASGHVDGGVRIWDSSTGLPVHVIHDAATPVTAIAYAPDAQTLAAGGADGKVRLRPVEDWH